MQLHRAGPGADGAARGGPGLPGPRGARTSSSPRSSQLYGEGLERIVAALDGRTPRGARPARRRRRRGQPAADPRPVPGRRSRRACSRRSTACGRTWSRTAATSSWSGIEDGVARLRLVGHCEGCPASAATLELAIKKALEEAAPDLEGLEVEGVDGRAPAFELPVVAARNGAAPPAWTDLDGEPPAAGLTAPMTVGGADVLVANVGGTLLAYRNACGWCRARLDARADDAGRHAHLPVVRAALRAAPRGPLARRRRAADRAGAAAARRGPGARGGRVMATRRSSPACGASSAPAVERRPPRADGGRAASCARCRWPTTTSTCSTSRSGGSSASARRAGRSAPARRATGRPARARCGSRPFELSDELWAAFQIPIGLAFFLRSSQHRATIVGLYPSPAGATECELDLDAWERLVAANPVLEDLDPDAEALIVNRLATPHVHAIAPLDDCYRLVGIIKATWEGITGGAAMEAAVQRYFDDLRGDGDGAMSELAGAARARVHGARRRADRARGDARRALPPARRRARGARGLHDRALDPDPHRPGAARRTTTRRASGWSSCSARPSAGARRRTRSSGRASSRSCRRSPARRRSRSRCRARTTSRSRRPSTSTRCATATSRSASTSTAPCSTAATTTACRSCSCRGAARRVADAGRRVAADDRRALPGRRLDPAAARDARRARARARPSAGCTRSTTRSRDLL